MTTPPFELNLRPPIQIPGEPNSDYRARVAREQADALARRQEELMEQTSDRHTPEERVRLWERLHSLELPRAADHPLVRVIATSTHLTMDQVRGEQQRRSTPISG
jgi:hypothetical protein